MKLPKDYLGDFVYAEFDGSCITLTTENDGSGNSSNIIALEPHVLAALIRFDKRAREVIQQYLDSNKKGKTHETQDRDQEIPGQQGSGHSQ